MMVAGKSSMHRQLVNIIFAMDPFVDGSGVSLVECVELSNSNLMDGPDAFLNLIVAMVSANSTLLPDGLRTLWRMCSLSVDLDKLENDDIYEKGKVEAIKIAKDQIDEDLSLEETKAKKFLSKSDQITSLIFHTERNQRLHSTLEKILHLVPSGKSEIFHQLSRHFPYKLRSLQCQIAYAKQCVLVLEYVPTIHGTLLDLIVDKCLEMDVEIHIEEKGVVGLCVNEKRDNGDGKMDTQAENNIVVIDIKNCKCIPTNVENSTNNKLSSSFDDNQIKHHVVTERKYEEERVDEMAEKLDSLMFLLFQHLQKCSMSSSMEPSRLYRMIIKTFYSIILTTHRSKYVQFVIFLLCGLDHDYHTIDSYNHTTVDVTSEHGYHQQPSKLYRVFATELLQHILDPYQSTITRRSAACYLASFVSRASYVCPETVCECVSALLRIAEAYMEKFNNDASICMTSEGKRNMGDIHDRNGGDRLGSSLRTKTACIKINIHSFFYTICQAAFYIICFRGRECLKYYRETLSSHRKEKICDDIDKDHVEVFLYGDPRYLDIGKDRWTRLCTHWLQPLRYCLESVRGEFLILAGSLKLLDNKLYERLTRDNEAILCRLSKGRINMGIGIKTAATLEMKRMNGGVGGLGRGSNPLGSFFPFDPYLLRSSYQFIEPYYKDWDGEKSTEDDISEEDASERNCVSELEHNEIEEENESISFRTNDSIYNNDNDYTSPHREELCCIVSDNEEESGCSFSTSLLSTISVYNDGPNNMDNNVLVQGENDIKDGEWINELTRARTLSITDNCW